MWSTIVGFITGGLSQYKAWVYAAIAALVIGLGVAVYVFRAKAGTATVKLQATEKERDFYHYQLNEAVASHNDYVAQLGEIQGRKDKVQVIYRDRMRRINDEAVGTISGHLVIFSMREFDAYTSATAR